MPARARVECKHVALESPSMNYHMFCKNQNFSAMRLNLVLYLLLVFTFSMFVARSFSIDGGPQKNTPISEAKHDFFES